MTNAEKGFVKSSGGNRLPRPGKGWKGRRLRDVKMSTSAIWKTGTGPAPLLVTVVEIAM